MDLAFQHGYRGTSLWVHLAISLQRIFLAFVIASLIAIPLGLFSGYFPTIRSIIAPIIYFYRPLPPLAYYTLLIIWMGIGDLSKIALLVLAGIPPIYIACVSAMENTDPNKLVVARTLGATTPQLFRYVIIPSCLPEIFAGLRTSFGFIYTTLVAAEMVAAVSGIGWMVLDAGKFLRSDIIFVGILIMGLTGVLIDTLFQYIENKLIPWKGKGT